MDGYKTLLRKDTAGWLLEDINPSARYFTLKDILDYPEDAPELMAAREIMLRGPVPEIREKQKATKYIKRERALLNAGRLFFWKNSFLLDLQHTCAQSNAKLKA